MSLDTLDHRAPSLFKQQASRTSQLALYSALALFLMVADARFKITTPVRSALSVALSPVQWVVAQPVLAYQNASRYAEVQQQAVAREDAARKELVVMAQRAELADEGVARSELDGAVAAVVDAVAGLLAEPRGRWLFDRSHTEARGEWALSGVLDHELVRVVVDRSFVADGVRWIVDFKTGVHEGADVAGFLAREEARYRPQLDRYATLVRLLDPRPIRVGLYFPRLGAWREWTFAG